MASTAKNSGATTEVAAGNGNAATINGETPSAADVKFIFTMITNFASKPNVDWDAVAAAIGVKGRKSRCHPEQRLSHHDFQPSLSFQASRVNSFPFPVTHANHYHSPFPPTLPKKKQAPWNAGA